MLVPEEEVRVAFSVRSVVVLGGVRPADAGVPPRADELQLTSAVDLVVEDRLTRNQLRERGEGVLQKSELGRQVGES
jgi:hypothetical protein